MPKKTRKKQPAPKTPKTAPKKKAPPRPATKAAAAAAEPPKSPPPARKPAKGKSKPPKAAAPKETPTKAPKKPAAKAPKKPATKANGKCGSGTCSSGTCPARKQLDGRSLFDRARECKDLEECRKFIGEFNEAIEQANQWLDDMHAQALSAEETRDLYGEQISDLLEAVDLDRARIAELEAELKKARAGTPKSAAADAVLGKLAELDKEVRSIRADLRRLLDGRGPSAERRQRARAAERQSQGRRRGRPPKAAVAAASSSEAPARQRGASNALVVPGSARAAKTMRRGAGVAPGAFPKYSVLRGAACSLGVGKYGYPPEVCAPAAFSREEAAQILGTFAQNKYGGLAKWALITGLPIDDVAVPLPPQPAAGRKAAPSSTPRRRTSTGKAPRSNAGRTKASKATAERSNRQILDQVLLTVARV